MNNLVDKNLSDIEELKILKKLANKHNFDLIKKSNVKFCWLDINTGEFSNSWSYSEQEALNYNPIQDANNLPDIKLIKYQCLNTNFEFLNIMKIVTNIK